MKGYFVDTNVFLRLLLNDHKTQSLLAKKIFQKAEKGEISLWTTDIVILEIIWTLTSFYRLSRKKIHYHVNSLFALENFKILNRDFLIRALDDFIKKNVDFVDAYNFYLACKANKKILSFDRDFDKLGKRENIEKIVK